jgi:putative RecB family exonuclease
MALPLPSTLSPSKVSSFRDCALAFRFSAIDKLPEPPSEPALKGTTVHRALELLFHHDAQERTPEVAAECVAAAVEELRNGTELAGLGLDGAGLERFVEEASVMVGRYFELEDPRSIEPVGLELMLEAEIGDVAVRGIIDRLERDAQGALVVTDYKTGKAPSVDREAARLAGVHFYAYLCRAALGEVPARIQLVYLGRDPQVIVAEPSEQSLRGLEVKVRAVWAAVQRACELEDFRPRTGPLCNWCAFQAYCPAFGGDPAAARAGATSEGGGRPLDAAVP